MRDIVESTAAYEAWMKRRADISGRLLEKKHDKMAERSVPVPAGDVLPLGRAVAEGLPAARRA